MRLVVAALALLTASALVRCDCNPPVDPPLPIGAGTPIGPPDAGDVYEVDAGPVVCEEDDNEDNDLRADAVAVAGSIEGRACGDDDDWYAVDALDGCTVDARLEAGAGTGDIDMLLFDPDGQLVGSSTLPGATEAINVIASKDGVYAARLRCGSRDDVPYTLTMSATCDGDLVCPDDDTHENNDSATQPAPVDEGVPADGILCGLDEDWYAVPVSVGCLADASVSFTDVDGDIDFELYAADGITRVANSAGTSDSEQLVKGVTEAGMRYRLFFFSAAAANPYRVVVNEICAGQIACPADDPFEPNDAVPQARRLFAPRDEVIATICGDDDFFDVFPQQSCTLHATLTFEHALGDLDLQLLDAANGTVLGASEGTADVEAIDYAAPNTARIALRVFGFSDAVNGYRLRLETTCP